MTPTSATLAKSDKTAEPPAAASATLNVGGKSVELPIRKGTVGPSVIDIGKLYAQTGMFTYDPGFTSTASTEFEDHLHRRRRGRAPLPGLPDRRARRARRFPRDLLPAPVWRVADRGAEGRLRLSRHPPHDGARSDEPFLQRFPPRRASDVGDGGLRRRARRLLSRLDRHHRSLAARSRLDPHDRENADARGDGLQICDRPAIRLSEERARLLARISCACASRSRARTTRSTPVLARALDRIFILHADHEQNASTSTVRLAGSSGANPFACIAAGIACLWGPAHGGANEAALKMLGEIGRVENIPKYIAKAKDKNDPFRLMGFGHRVYKNYDPRAKIMQKHRARGAQRARGQGRSAA